MTMKYSQEELDQLSKLLSTQVPTAQMAQVSPRAEQFAEQLRGSSRGSVVQRALPKKTTRYARLADAVRMQQQYEDIVATIGEFIVLAGWLTLWCLNAWFTVSFAARFGIPMLIALPIHFICTIIELHLWRRYRKGYIFFIMLVAFIDLFSSAYELSALLSTYLGMPLFELWWVVGYTIGAIFIAIMPEQQVLEIVFDMIARKRKKG